MKDRKRATGTHGHDRRIAGRAQMDGSIDPYQRRAKLSEPTVCPDCGAVFHRGRWQWTPAPADAVRATCPACQRIRDDAPAGIVVLQGPFVLEHREEIQALVRHQEDEERSEHPLNRIMAIRELAEGLEITTTDIHLPRRIGEAVRRACKGDLDIHHDEARYFVRVRWSRDVESGA